MAQSPKKIKRTTILIFVVLIIIVAYLMHRGI